MHLADEFGDYNENKAKKTSASIKRPIRGGYLSSNHISYTVSNFAKNISNYVIPEAKKAFDQLCQDFIEVPIRQHFDLEKYIQVENNMSGHTIGRVLSQLINDLGQ